MKKIKKPLSDKNVEMIFNTCVDAYEIEDKRNELREMSEKVISTTEEYNKYIPNNFVRFQHPDFDEFEKKSLVRLYDYMIVQKRIGGYYDSIMSNVNRICPFCGEGMPKNLDHFLPKSEYPFLAVTPDNLVPSCRDCNMEKNSDKPVNNEDVPLHPYYDEITDIWLEVNLDFSQKEFIGFEYYNGFDASKNPVLSGRIDAHIRVHGLQSNFETHANSMINSKKRNHLKTAEQSIDELRKDLTTELISFELEDKNSWRSALYRSLIKNIDVYVKWLEQAVVV